MIRFVLCGLAVALLAVAGQTQDPTLETRVRDLLAQVKTGTDADRTKAAMQLQETLRKDGFGKVPVADVVASVSGFAKEKNEDLRRAMVSALAAVRDEAALPLLIESLDDRFTASSASAGLQALGPKAKDAIPKLVAGIKGGKLTGNVFEALVAIAGDDAAPLILDSIADRKKLEPNAFDQAVRALARLAHPRVFDFMVKILEERGEQRYSDNSLYAAMYFASIDDEKSVVQLRKCLAYLPLPADAKEGPLSTKLSTQSSVRQIAVEALGKKKDKESFETIQKMVADDPSIRVRTAAVAALGEYADKRSVPVLVKAFAQVDSGFEAQGHIGGKLRTTAVWSLARIGTEEALTALYEGMLDGPAKTQCTEFWVKTKEPKHFTAFLKHYDAKPIEGNLGAGIIESMLRGEEPKKLTAKEQAAAEADFLKNVDDPKRFGKDADLTNKGQYTVKMSFLFHREGFATVSFGYRPVNPRGFGYGEGFLYRKVGDAWKPLGQVYRVVE